MISQCANPACSRPFHSLGRGHLFRFEVRHPSEPCRDIPYAVCSKRPGHASVYFWLCETCAQTLTLRFDPHTGVRLMPHRPAVSPATDRAAAPAGMK